MENGNDNNQKRKFERKPNFDMVAKLSRDGRFWIIKRVETWILPRKYLDVIAQSHAAENGGATASNVEVKRQKKGKRDDNGNGQGN